MNTGLHCIEWMGLAGLARVGGDDFPDQPETVERRTFGPGFVWLPAALIIGLGAWMLMSGSSSKTTAENDPVRLAAAAAPEPAPSPATGAAQDGSVPNPLPPPVAALSPAEAPPPKRLPSTG